MTERDQRQQEPERLVNGQPERLVHDPDVGMLISRANAAYRAGLDETGAFQRLSERQEASERGWRWQGLTLGAVLSVAAGLVLVLGVFDDPPNQLAVGPEVSAGRRSARAGGEPTREGNAAGLEARDTRRAPPGDAALVVGRLSSESAKRAEADADDPRVDAVDERPVAPRPQPAVRERQSAESAAARDLPSAERTREAEKQIVGAPELAAPARPESAKRANPTPEDRRAGGSSKGLVREEVAAPAEATGASSAARTPEARLDCSDMVNNDAQAAEHCYVQRAAESSGLSAEAALYELARLRRDVRRDSKGALQALNDYRERFPQGSLRNEVGLSRVELLSELGRSREALNEAEALLGSAKGGERAAELYLLRGGIYRRDLSDFARAAQEYAQAEAFGGTAGAEATRLRGLSLEALGDVEGALEAYRRYLSGPVQPRKNEVNRRVEALTATQRGKVP